MSAALLGLGFNVITPSHASKLVLLKLVDACDDDGTNIFPAVATIARKAQCSERQVQRELKRFQAVGLLILVEPGGRGPGDTAKYRLDVPTMMRIAEAGWPEGDAGGDAATASESAEKGDTVSPLAKGDTGDIKGDIGEAKGDQACHPTPPLDPSIDPERGAREAAGKAETGRRGEEREPGLGIDAAWAALGKAWPDFPLANEDLVRRALSGLSGGERKTVVARIPAFLAFHRERQGKAKLPPLHVYVGQTHHWQALPAGQGGDIALGERTVIGAFERAWWWLWFDFVARFPAELRDQRSPAATRLRNQVNLARQRVGWKVGPAKVAEIEAAAKAFVQIKVDGDEFGEWAKSLRLAGAELPRPDKVEWVWVPSQWPGDEREREARLRDEVAEMNE